MKIVDEEGETYKLSFGEAREYFDTDLETLEFLEALTEDEKNNFNMLVHVDTTAQHVSYVYGHTHRNSPHLPQVGNGIMNGVWEDDDYSGAIEKLQSMFGGEK